MQQQLQLITLAGIKVNEPVYEISMPTESGDISVYPGHEPLVTVAKPGAISVRFSKDSDEVEFYAITGGIVKIDPEGVEVLVDEADSGEDIIEADTQAALQRAIELRDNAQDQVELDRAHQLVDRHSVRLKVADLHRRRRRRGQ